MAIDSALSARRHDLDWVRLFALGALILFHLSELYTAFPWRTTSEQQTELALFHAALRPWRMALIFTLSGVAARALADRVDAETLWARRWPRLITPLLFGMIFLLPLQIYCVLIAKWNYSESFLTFLGHYFSPGHAVSLGGSRYTLPLFLDLWYLAYLAGFTLLLAGALKWAPVKLRWLGELTASRTAGPGLLAWPLLFLSLLSLVAHLDPGRFTDACRTAAFFGLFLFGFFIAASHAAWDAFVRFRWLSLSMACAAFGVFGYYTLTAGSGDPYLAAVREPVLRLIKPVEAWGAICAILGFARLHLQRPHPVLLYLSPAVLTVYVLHHPVVVISAFLLRPYHLARWMEAGVILLVTVSVCIFGYEALRRTRSIRPLEGAARLGAQTSATGRRPSPPTAAQGAATSAAPTDI